MTPFAAKTPASMNPIANLPGPVFPTVHPLSDKALHHLKYTQGKHWDGATPHDRFVSLAMAVRDFAIEKLIDTQAVYVEQRVKRVYYLSLEYLLGRLLRSNLVNLGLLQVADDGVAALGSSLDEICEIEPDAGLGNGGLGRLAACYLDSAATLQYPVYGYGIRYECGIFEQQIKGGWQLEQPEYWLRYGSPWEIVRPEFSLQVRLKGRVEHITDSKGGFQAIWKDCDTVIGVPYDFPIIGYNNNTVNILRLWSARASSDLDLEKFNQGGYIEAVRDKALSETITKVLYPADQTEQGKRLRLVQQYFFVACTIGDMLRRYERENDSLEFLPDKVALQLNDTHPTLAVAELMRVLVDEQRVTWEKAWDLTRSILNYTNHTLLPEALETWPVRMLQEMLPRHLEIIYEINRRFLGEVELRWPGDDARKRRLSLISEDEPRSVRMAHLAIVGSKNVNGVAKLHSDLIRSRLVPDFAEFWPERFTNVTNGVTPRRWLLSCNPGLAELITARIGDGWPANLDRLSALANLADDPDFQRDFRGIKQANKERMANWVDRRLGLSLPPASLFDVQVKRLHEYKRQLLNILHVVMLYHQMLDDPESRISRVVIFAAKAAPSYQRAKLIIKLICDVAATINRDRRIGDRLRVAFLPNYCVSLAEIIVPAADLSEQISTAGMEASGTGNMKFALNGALTVGTLDGANIEIRDAVGKENFFLFGLTAEQVAARRGRHNPWDIYNANAAVRRALDAIATGAFNSAEPALFRPIVDSLTRDGDDYMLLADIESYAKAQSAVETLWKDERAWTRAAILNVARMAYFSSDRAIHEYAKKIWNVSPVPVRESK
jgi:starch phosphorylase